MNPLPAQSRSSLKPHIIEGIILLLGTSLIPYLVIGDREVFLYGYSEHSLTEIIQAVLVSLTAVIYWHRSVRVPAQRAWLQAMAGFFTIVLIREMDFYLDFVYHGFWSLLASLMLVLVVVLAWRSRGTFRAGLEHFLAHSAHVYVMIGITIVILFSRLFGSSDFLLAMMEDQYHPAFKTFLQEGLETFGYFLVTMGSLKYVIISENRNP